MLHDDRGRSSKLLTGTIHAARLLRSECATLCAMHALHCQPVLRASQLEIHGFFATVRGHALLQCISRVSRHDMAHFRCAIWIEILAGMTKFTWAVEIDQPSRFVADSSKSSATDNARTAQKKLAATYLLTNNLTLHVGCIALANKVGIASEAGAHTIQVGGGTNSMRVAFQYCGIGS